MRHLAVGQACPMDGARVTRSHCSACPSFVSFRVSDEVATVGCDWGDDVAGWLRREMSRPDAGPQPRASARRAPPVRAAVPAPARRPRSGPPGAAGAVGVFLAAFGVGLALSALDRPG